MSPLIHYTKKMSEFGLLIITSWCCLEGLHIALMGEKLKQFRKMLTLATTIIGLARYSDDYTRSAGPTMIFAKHNSDHPEHRPNIPAHTAQGTAVDPQPAKFAPRPGAAFPILRHISEYSLGFATRKLMLSGNRIRFSSAIPLSHIFGFCSGVRKVIFGANHTVVLYRKPRDNDAIWREDGAAAGKVILSKLALWIPVMSSSIADEQRLLSFMDTGGKSLMSWLTTSTDSIQSNILALFTWHIASQQGVSALRHIFVALQGMERVYIQEENSMVFDNCDVTGVLLRINGYQEPSEDIDKFLKQLGRTCVSPSDDIYGT